MDADLVKVAAVTDAGCLGYVVTVQVERKLGSVRKAMMVGSGQGMRRIRREKNYGEHPESIYEFFVTAQLEHERRTRTPRPDLTWKLS